MQRSEVVNALRMLPFIGTFFAMMLDSSLAWCQRIPIVNILRLMTSKNHTFDDMTKFQDFIGLASCFLLALPIAFLTSVEYDELEEADARYETICECGCSWLCNDDSPVISSSSPSMQLSHVVNNSWLAGSTAFGIVIYAQFLNMGLKAEADRLVEDCADKDELMRQSAAKVQAWLRPLILVQYVALIISITENARAFATIVTIKFPDHELYSEGSCVEDCRNTIADSTYFHAWAFDSFVNLPYIILLPFASCVMYESDKFWQDKTESDKFWQNKTEEANEVEGNSEKNCHR